MSDRAQPDVDAYHELEQLIRSLGQEMATWRRRAHEAESRVSGLESELAARQSVTGIDPVAVQRENGELRRRLETARQRTQALADRLRFLRQQHESGGGVER